MFGRLGEVFLECFGDDFIFEDGAVFGGHESVVYYLVHFMSPETHEVFGCFKFVDVRLHDAFLDFVDVAHVEDVVEFDWSS